MKFIFYLFLLLFTLLSAAELVTKSHLLKSGDLITFYPKQGETLSVGKDFKHLIPRANYDIVMKNGTRVYFENRNQEDDMYIIFNDATEPGDVVQIKVNRGFFNYTTQSFEALPKTVKKILKASTKRQKSGKHIKHMKDAVVETEEFCFDAMGNIIECRPASTVQQSPVKMQTASVAKREVTHPVSEAILKKEEKDGTNFLDLFAQKIKKALASISEDLRDVRKDEKKRAASQTKPEKPVQQHIVDKPLKITQKNSKPANINKYNTPSDQEVAAGTILSAPKFHSLPENIGMVEQFDQMSVAAQVPRLQSSPAVVPEEKPAAEVYQKPAIAAQAKFAPYDNLNQNYAKPTYQKPAAAAYHEEKTAFSDVRRPDLKVSAPAFAQKKLFAETKTAKPALGQAVRPDDFAGSQGSGLPSAVSKPQIASRRGVPSFETKIAQNRVSEKTVQPDLRRAAPQLPAQPTPAMHERVSGPGLTQIAAPQVKPVAPVVSETLSKPVIEPVAPPKIEPQEPVVVETPETPKEESAPSNKIVITKIINKKRSPAQTAPLERMSDRLLGGGYSEQHNMGQVGVKAYSNRKPISAWVEVYKGKRRVKTFYTSGGKLVKLPAGTYVLKATYRTGTSKQKKSLGRVRLHEGDTIRKRVYFNVGKLNIVAKRKGKPVYVKVEIYKNGSKRRYAYTFSSQITGEAHLQLAEGKYKIVVLEHGTKKVFDNVRIKGSASKTLRVEF